MSDLVYELITDTARIRPEATAISYREEALSYSELEHRVRSMARSLMDLGLARQERVAVYLEKRLETVVSVFGASMAGGVFVPINPLLKPPQVCHILQDCNVRVLVTTMDRAAMLGDSLSECADLRTLIVVGMNGDAKPDNVAVEARSWNALNSGAGTVKPHRIIDTDMAAILYTSGSTGKPKGVVLSHRNMVAGARSVAQYLENVPDDRILTVLPLSFDAGFSQLTTAFHSGAHAVLMNYLLPNDVIRTIVKYQITGLGAVPPLWIPLSKLDWPKAAAESLRYVTNTGGAMPRTTVDALRKALPHTRVYLMYGLTEAFRSTYLPPEELDRRPDSIGKAIPNAEILVIRSDGSLCAPGEPGELVHRGALVSQGYWNDPERTAERYKPAPCKETGVVVPEIAVWSGDTVQMDTDGYLYFIGRKDEMIKTSGYRVSPTEIEEVIYQSGLVAEAVAIGIPDPTLGQGIVVVAVPAARSILNVEQLLEACRQKLPNFMVPARVHARSHLPRNPNGKIDRRRIAKEFEDEFVSSLQ